MTELACSPWLRGTAIWTDLADEKQDRKQKSEGTCPADKPQLIRRLLDEYRDLIFGLLFFSCRVVQYSQKAFKQQEASLGGVVHHWGRYLPRVAPWGTLPKGTGLRWTSVFCVCVSLKLCCFCTQGGAGTRTQAAEAASGGHGWWIVTPHFYPQWLNSHGTDASSSATSFSLYPHSFHLSSVQTGFSHCGSMTAFLFPFLSPFLLWPVGLLWPG